MSERDIHPVWMKCTGCGEEGMVEVPAALMPLIDTLEFRCGDCGPGDEGR